MISAARMRTLMRRTESLNVFVRAICCLIVSSALSLVHSADFVVVAGFVWANDAFAQQSVSTIAMNALGKR